MAPAARNIASGGYSLPADIAWIYSLALLAALAGLALTVLHKEQK